MPRKRKEIVQLLQQASALQSPVLDISHCQIGDLLEQVCRMDWLTELNLSHCHLSSLPDTIGNLTRLSRLVLCENQLATLPESISRLTALQYLDLTRAGYEFTVSATVTAWLQSVPEVHWPDGVPPTLEPEVALHPDHPNLWLEWLKSALALYGVALAMEDHNAGGSAQRAEADASIAQIFRQVPELEDILPEFYRDFQAQRFYSVNRDSEKTLDDNPFRLPTPVDEKWLADSSTGTSPPDQIPPLYLRDEIREVSRHIVAYNNHTEEESWESEVFACEYGRVSVSNQPYAEDEEYFADCEAWLYQAGPRRFYLRAVVYGYGGSTTIRWYGSGNGGQTWQSQARLTHEWLETTFRHWRQLGHIPVAATGNTRAA